MLYAALPLAVGYVLPSSTPHTWVTVAKPAVHVQLFFDDEPSWGRDSMAEVQTTTNEVALLPPNPAKAAQTLPRAYVHRIPDVWLDKLDAPSLGLPRLAAASLTQAKDTLDKVTAEAVQMAEMTDQCDSGDDVACDSLSKEAEAKKAWLAKVDVQAMGAAAAAVSGYTTATATGAMSEDAAKSAWLAKLDAPSWGETASTLSKVVAEATSMAQMTEKCDQGEAQACDSLSREDEAKKQWLAKLDVPAWGAAAAAVGNMAHIVAGGESGARTPTAGSQEAKAAWLTKIGF